MASLWVAVHSAVDVMVENERRGHARGGGGCGLGGLRAESCSWGHGGEGRQEGALAWLSVGGAAGPGGAGRRGRGRVWFGFGCPPGTASGLASGARSWQARHGRGRFGRGARWAGTLRSRGAPPPARGRHPLSAPPPPPPPAAPRLVMLFESESFGPVAMVRARGGRARRGVCCRAGPKQLDLRPPGKPSRFAGEGVLGAALKTVAFRIRIYIP